MTFNGWSRDDPPEPGRYLVREMCDGLEDTSIGLWDGERWRSNDYLIESPKVSWWMPLPEPPP